MGIWDHRGLGRIFISLIFIVAGATQINEWEEMRKVVWQKMVDHGYESTGMPPLLLGCAVSLQLVGGLAVLVGFCRFGVALLITFLLPVSAKMLARTTLEC